MSHSVNLPLASVHNGKIIFVLPNNGRADWFHLEESIKLDVRGPFLGVTLLILCYNDCVRFPLFDTDR